MAKWHYYDENGNKIGPVRGRELKELAQQGAIAPDTRVEDENGLVALAKQVTGLSFPGATPIPTASNSYSVVPSVSEEPSSVIVPPTAQSKANWYYYNGNREKFGPITSGELKQLVLQGTVTPETFVEDPTGRTGLAKDVKGLTFPEVANAQNAAPTYYYIDENGYKHGPMTTERLQSLVERGTITPMSQMETVGGDKWLAGQLPDLKFNAVVSPLTEPVPNNPFDLPPPESPKLNEHEEKSIQDIKKEVRKLSAQTVKTIAGLAAIRKGIIIVCCVIGIPVLLTILGLSCR